MRNDIVCPNCGTPIKIDDVTRNSIVKQVRDSEFFDEVKKQTETLKSQMQSELKAAQSNAKLEMKEELEKKDAEILRLNKEKEYAVNEATKTIFERDRKYNTLKDETGKKIAELQKQVDMNKINMESAVANAVAKERQNSHDKDLKIVQLTEEIKQGNAIVNARLAQMKNGYEANILSLQNDIANLKNIQLVSEQGMKEKYDALLKAKDEEIDYYKSYKAKLSVKLLGESLEEHCMNEFNTIRPFLPNAVFEKDNVISPETRSKGDFIYRELYKMGVELTSIMFEMKNESDDSTHKHKNEDFFKELDKDRKEKKCEYAVLVSMLEPESETYNRGIVDVSSKYDKMYVIRPQFFIPLITILRGAALNTLNVKEELERLKNQSVDVSNFETNLEGYKEAIAKCFELATKKKESAVNNIDKAIALLQKVRDDLTKYESHEEHANKKAHSLTIKKLTKNAPAVLELIKASECCENVIVEDVDMDIQEGTLDFIDASDLGDCCEDGVAEYTDIPEGYLESLDYKDEIEQVLSEDFFGEVSEYNETDI